MTSQTPDATALEELAVTLAGEAAAAAMAARAAGLSIDAKSTSTDLVTQVDRDTEQLLVDRIAVARPDDGVLGEEGGGRPGRSGVRWVIDPIDGTVNFVLGLPQWAVSVAAEVDGVVVAGAVADPASGETFHAAAGGGAWLDSGAARLRLTGPREVQLARAVVATGFGYDAGRRARQAAVVARLLPRIGDIRRLGAASLDLCFVAAGRLDGYFEAGLQPWDHAAGGLIAREAGCVTSGLHGRPAGDALCVACGPSLATDLIALLEELGADRVLDADDG